MPNPESTFECTAGPLVTASRRRLTALLVALAVAALLAAFYAWVSERPVPAFLAAGVATLALFALRLSGDLDPRRLALSDGRLSIQTRRHLIEKDITSARARRLEPGEIERLGRLVSTGGFVTAAGGFDSRRLGEFDLYASDLSNAVLLEVGDDRLIVTPDEPERFLESLTGSRVEGLDAPPARGGRGGELTREA